MMSADYLAGRSLERGQIVEGSPGSFGLAFSLQPRAATHGHSETRDRAVANGVDVILGAAHAHRGEDFRADADRQIDGHAKNRFGTDAPLHVTQRKRGAADFGGTHGAVDQLARFFTGALRATPHRFHLFVHLERAAILSERKTFSHDMTPKMPGQGLVNILSIVYIMGIVNPAIERSS